MENNMSNNKIAEMKARLAKRQEQIKVEVSEASELRRLTAKLEVLDNPRIQASMVSASIKRATTTKLVQLHEQCAVIIEETPLYNERTQQDRAWRPRRYFDLGNQVDLMYQLLSGIMYSAQDHKDQLLDLVDLDMDMIETAVTAFGTPASFYQGILTSEEPFDADVLASSLTLIGDKLDIDIDMTSVTYSKLRTKFIRARNKASLDELNDAKTMGLEDQLVTM